LKNWPTALLLLFLWLFSQGSLADPDKEEVTIVDDGWVEVPLDFTFPFYGNNYVTSFMFANGVIGFMDPGNIPGTGISYDGLCCNSFDFTASNNNYGNYGGVRFDYVIMPWHTDLIDIGTGKFYIQGDTTFQSYFWENISEYYDNTDLNTFDTTIYPTGNIRFAYQALDIQSHSVTVAIVGDLSAGEYTQWFYNNPSTDGGVYWTSGDTAPVEISGGQSICDVDSTASYVCTYYAVGYAEEIYNNGCAASALYDSGCTGYATAYLAQQCGISSLYDPSCTGYETAYLDNQCVLDATYSPYCPGYSAATAEEETEYEWEEEYEEDYDYAETEEYETTYYDYPTFEPEIEFEEVFEAETFDSSDFMPDTNTYGGGFEPEISDYDVTFEEVFAEIEMEMMEEFEDFSMDMFEDTFEDMEFDMPNIEDFEDIEFDMPEMDSTDFELPELENLTEEVMEEIPEIELEPEIETEEVLTEETLEEPEMEEPEMEPELEPEPEEVQDDEPSEETETEETESETEEEGEILEESEEESEDEQDEQQEEEAEEEDEGSSDEESDEELEEEVEEETESEEEESEETMMAESEEEEEVEVVAEAEIKEPSPADKKKAKEKKMREIITAKLKSLATEMGEAASLAEQQELQNFIIALLNFNLGFNSYNSSMIDGTFYLDRDIYLNMKVPENQRGLRNGLANEILHNKLVDIQYEENYGRSRVQGD